MVHSWKEVWRLWIDIRDRCDAPYLALSVAPLIYHARTPVSVVSIHYRESKASHTLTITEPAPSHPCYGKHNRAGADLDNGHMRTISSILDPITQLT